MTDPIEYVVAAFVAVRAGDATSLKKMLDIGVPPNVRNERGDSLLMLASYHGHLEATKLLIERGADPEQKNDAGQTPLAGAAFKGQKPIVEALIDGGAKVDGACGNGQTPLMFAAMFGHDEIVQLLVDRGADPTLTDAAGANALGMTQMTGATGTAALLEKLIAQRGK